MTCDKIMYITTNSLKQITLLKQTLYYITALTPAHIITWKEEKVESKDAHPSTNCPTHIQFSYGILYYYSRHSTTTVFTI